MSRITEIAEAEAAAAEAEAELAPDELAVLAETNPDDDNAAVELPAEAEKRMEAVGTKLDKQSQSHVRAVQRIMGDDFADVTPCPMCQIPGFVFDPVGGSPEFELRREAVDAYFAAGGKPLNPDPTVQTCGSCGGWGVRSTPSHVPNQGERQCPDCMGQGWVAREAVAMAQSQPWTPQPVYPAGLPVGNNGGVADDWGRPPGAQRYGQDPAQNGGLW
jgi:hypothetical protein